MALSADQILATDDLKPVPVPVPEWGGDVLVRGLTGTEGEAWSASTTRRLKNPDGSFYSEPNMQGAGARLLVMCCVDESGGRLFTDDQAAALGAKNGAVLKRLTDKALELSGLTDDTAEVIAGESEAVPSDGSSSTSPESSDSTPSDPS